jgi:hypothetical protein
MARNADLKRRKWLDSTWGDTGDLDGPLLDEAWHDMIYNAYYLLKSFTLLYFVYYFGIAYNINQQISSHHHG